jgi:hypothetical protein
MWRAEKPDDTPEKRVEIADSNENDGGESQAADIVTGRGYLAQERRR